MRTKRQQAVEREINALESGALRAVSNMQVQVDLIKIMVPWMHHNIVTDSGDITAENRADLSDSLDPALASLLTMITGLQEVAAIFSEDVETYSQNVAGYITAHTSALAEAENRLK